MWAATGWRLLGHIGARPLAPGAGEFFFGTTFDLYKADIRMRNRETTPLRTLWKEGTYSSHKEESEDASSALCETVEVQATAVEVYSVMTKGSLVNQT